MSFTFNSSTISRNLSRGISDHFKTSEDAFKYGETVKKTAKQGDIIEILRGTYCHYALWMGSNNTVLNVRPDENKGRNRLAKIKLCPFDNLLDKPSRLVKVAQLDDIAHSDYGVAPKTPSEILASAMAYLGKDVPYELFQRNCEYYCTLWRFGIGFSTQTSEKGTGDNYHGNWGATFEYTGTTCTNCKKSPIRNTRYVCGECRDFDLCGYCYAKEIQPKQHCGKDLRCIGNLGENLKYEAESPFRQGAPQPDVIVPIRQGRSSAKAVPYSKKK